VIIERNGNPVFCFFEKNSNFALIIFKVNVKFFQIGKEEVLKMVALKTFY
jgi:hypothetical protein